MLRTPLFHDDAVSAATQGCGQGGSAITAALTKDWNCEVSPIDGQLPQFTDVIGIDADVPGDEVVHMAQASVRFDNWLKRDTIVEKLTSMSEATTSAGTLHFLRRNEQLVHGRYNIQLAKDATMITAESKAFATVANGDIGIIYVLCVGQRYPYMGGKLIRAGDVADAASSGADVYDEAWNQKLNSSNCNTLASLDPTQNYILRGVGYSPAAKDKLAVAAKIEPQQHSNYWLAGLGTGNLLGSFETIYLHDGIPVSGSEEFLASTIGGAADTPHVWGVFESLTERGGNIGCGVANTPAARPAAPSFNPMSLMGMF